MEKRYSQMTPHELNTEIASLSEKARKSGTTWNRKRTGSARTENYDGKSIFAEPGRFLTGRNISCGRL